MPVERRRYTDGLETGYRVTIKTPATREEWEDFDSSWVNGPTFSELIDEWIRSCKLRLAEAGLWEDAKKALRTSHGDEEWEPDDLRIAGSIMSKFKDEGLFTPEHRSARVIFWAETRRARWQTITEQAPEELRKLVDQMEWATANIMEAVTALRYREALGANARRGRLVRENNGGKISAKVRDKSERNAILTRRYFEIISNNPNISKNGISKILAEECRTTGTELNTASGPKPPTARTIRALLPKK